MATADEQEHPYPAGTVGAALNGYWVDMVGVRKWYAAMGALAEHFNRDSTYHLSLQMPFDSSLREHVQRIEQDSVVRSALGVAGLKAEDFALLGCVYGIDRATRQLMDSLGSAGRPTNVGKELRDFFDANRREIDSLDRSLAAIGR
ncbi:MAG: hypothetical protein ABIY55_21510 [Kofleriaceae bacterium]